MKKNNKKILIIEDDPVLVEAMKIVFEDEGLEVYIHPEGRGAFEKTVEVAPDLIILDLVLPGIHGFDILKNLKSDKNLRQIPVIIATNLGEEADKKTAMQLGAVDFYIKATVDLEDLLKKIFSLLK